MRFYYCYELSGWFSHEYNQVIPPDAVEVDQETRIALLAGLEAGFVIVKGEDGMPELADRPGPSLDQLQAKERVWRDAQLALTDPLVMRHRDELELSEVTTLTSEQYSQLQAYRSELRNWPNGSLFPASAHRPFLPSWFAAEPV
ncbi:tail fiber assembly protein [Pseudomonas extremorientalis]